MGCKFKKYVFFLWFYKFVNVNLLSHKVMCKSEIHTPKMISASRVYADFTLN